jgi:hypothetical protein
MRWCGLPRQSYTILFHLHAVRAYTTTSPQQQHHSRYCLKPQTGRDLHLEFPRSLTFLKGTWVWRVESVRVTRKRNKTYMMTQQNAHTMIYQPPGAGVVPGSIQHGAWRRARLSTKTNNLVRHDY